MAQHGLSWRKMTLVGTGKLPTNSETRTEFLVFVAVDDANLGQGSHTRGHFFKRAFEMCTRSTPILKLFSCSGETQEVEQLFVFRVAHLSTIFT